MDLLTQTVVDKGDNKKKIIKKTMMKKKMTKEKLNFLSGLEKIEDLNTIDFFLFRW